MQDDADDRLEVTLDMIDIRSDDFKDEDQGAADSRTRVEE
jgi:hypothetical protein